MSRDTEGLREGNGRLPYSRLFKRDAMPHRTQRSLKHEYELYVEHEIEEYKDSIPRNVILSIGDEAVAELSRQPQLALDELVLCDEVDRIIRKRLRLPTYQTWRRRRLKLQARYRSPEHWGLEPNGPLVRAIHPATDARVLIAGGSEPGPALYLAANGCDVTALENTPDIMDRVMDAAESAGLASRVHGQVGSLTEWRPDAPLHAVVFAAGAFEKLSLKERDTIIRVLQRATLGGGVHLVQSVAADLLMPSFDELRSRYKGWEVSVDSPSDDSRVFLARKARSVSI